jgi:hypothetical protein
MAYTNCSTSINGMFKEKSLRCIRYVFRIRGVKVYGEPHSKTSTLKTVKYIRMDVTKIALEDID